MCARHGSWWPGLTTTAVPVGRRLMVLGGIPDELAGGSGCLSGWEAGAEEARCAVCVHAAPLANTSTTVSANRPGGGRSLSWQLGEDLIREPRGARGASRWSSSRRRLRNGGGQDARGRRRASGDESSMAPSPGTAPRCTSVRCDSRGRRRRESWRKSTLCLPAIDQRLRGRADSQPPSSHPRGLRPVDGRGYRDVPISRRFGHRTGPGPDLRELGHSAPEV
jgi:hypothetical protein